ncbi:MAG TPA: FAD-dependent oxidoreductase, partial [Caulobacteraceae bacterium]|nr:FAD-dependent oxidoreductase [Caulobacteraceae bacterium]
GVLSAPDMFLLGFTMLDLASHPFNRQGSEAINRLDVNGFIYSRGYSTEKVAKLQNYILMVIWSIQSDVTAAASYQDFVKHTLAFPRPTPFAWLLKGALYEKVVAPLEARLKSLGCEIRTGCKVSSVTLVNGEPRLRLERKGAKGGKPAAEAAPEADYLVLATPAPALATLAMNGPPGGRIVDTLPRLSELQRFRDVAIPVVDVYFTKTLPDIPKEQVGFTKSDIDLTLVDISQLWTDDANMKDRTVLVLAASNGYALPSAEPLEQGHFIIKRLHEYLPVFEPGDRWGDPKADIDWDKTCFRSNEQNKLFINDVGSWQWRPRAVYPEAPKIYFAGDFCQTDVDMATVEAAVQSGLMAARALQAEDAKATGARRGEPVTIADHHIYSDAAFLAAKLLLLPLAYASTAWSAITDRETILQKGPQPTDAYSPVTYTPLLPLAFALDWWKTVYWLGRHIAAGETVQGHDELGAFSHAEPQAGRIAMAPGAVRAVMTPGGAEPAAARSAGDHAAIGRAGALVGLGVSTLMTAADVLQTLASRLPTGGEAAGSSNLASALSAFSDQAWRTAQAAASQFGAGQERYQRRWRVKP